jgi:hypothetical protein
MTMKDDRLKISLQYFADDPDEGENTEGKQEQTRTFTQDELDAIISKRLARERKAWEAQLEEERKKAQMTEAEKAKAEAEEKIKEWESKVKAANERILKAEVKAAAAEMGIVDPEVAFLMIKDNVDEDLSNIKQLLEDLIKQKPYLKKSPANIGGGTNPGASQNAEENPWLPEYFNLTKQGQILNSDPAKAQALQEQARKRGF